MMCVRPCLLMTGHLCINALALLLLSFGFAHASVLPSQPTAQDSHHGGPDRIALSQLIRSDWPQSGSIFVRYATNATRNHLEIGYDFGTGAWFRIWNRDTLGGQEPNGTHYSGTSISPSSKAREPSIGSDWWLDDVFPEIALASVLDDTRRDVHIEYMDDGGWRIIASLPRGSREPVETMSDHEIGRWGGPEGMFRDVIYIVRPDHTIESVTAPTRPTTSDPRVMTEVFDVAACSPPGFQVVETYPSAGAPMSLIDCKFIETGVRESFLRDRVMERAVTRRMETPTISPVISAEQANADPDRPAPVEGGSQSNNPGRWAFVGAGVVLVLLGIGAWWKARQA